MLDREEKRVLRPRQKQFDLPIHEIEVPSSPSPRTNLLMRLQSNNHAGIGSVPPMFDGAGFSNPLTVGRPGVLNELLGGVLWDSLDEIATLLLWEYAITPLTQLLFGDTETPFCTHLRRMGR